MRQARRHIRITSGPKLGLLVVHIQLQSALHYKHEPLRRRSDELAAQFAAGFKFCCVLSKTRAHCRSCVHNCRAALHAGQGGADERIGRQEKMICLL